MMKLLKNKKNIMSILTALAIFVSTFGCTVFAASNSVKKLSNKQAVAISYKAFNAFGNLFALGADGKEITIGDTGYGKLKATFKDSKAFFSYVEKKTGVAKYYTKEYENQIVNFMTVMYRGNYYMIAGDPEIGIADLSSATVKSTTYSGKNATVILQGKDTDGKDATTTVTFTYKNGKWAVSNWLELNEGLRMSK